MAAPTTGPNGSSSSTGMIPAEWPVQAADKIVETIATIRDKTTKPALTAARGLVYGLVALIVGLVALFLLLVLIVRLYDNYVPGNVWPIYAILGLAQLIAGIVLFRMAKAPAPQHT